MSQIRIKMPLKRNKTVCEKAYKYGQLRAKAKHNWSWVLRQYSRKLSLGNMIRSQVVQAERSEDNKEAFLFACHDRLNIDSVSDCYSQTVVNLHFQTVKAYQSLIFRRAFLERENFFFLQYQSEFTIRFQNL
jgi:hypothetical protein